MVNFLFEKQVAAHRALENHRFWGMSDDDVAPIAVVFTYANGIHSNRLQVRQYSHRERQCRQRYRHPVPRQMTGWQVCSVAGGEWSADKW